MSKRNYSELVDKKLGQLGLYFYSQRAFKKRESLDCSGDPKYGDWESLYKAIVANSLSKDKLEVTIHKDFDPDEGENEFSESEVYGCIFVYPEITIKTPKTNKIKAIINGRHYL